MIRAIAFDIDNSLLDFRSFKEKTARAAAEAMVGTKKRLKLIAKDIVEHFEKRQEAMQGKGMIVCMSRRICVELYNEIIKLRPKWHSQDDDKGFLKVVMTGSASDPEEWQQHIRNAQKRRHLKDRMKDPNDELTLAIVRDMWLTGFDVPSMHTMYVDKPMQGHTLMQGIARVNRVFKDKQGGLVVDYLGLAGFIKKALAEYSTKDRQDACATHNDAAALLEEKLEIVQNLFHKFNYQEYFTGTQKKRLQIISAAIDHALSQENGKKRLLQGVTELSKTYALAVPHPYTLKVNNEIAFFQAVKSACVKLTAPESSVKDDLDSAINQIVSKAVTTDKIVDIYAAAGIKNPDISILSDEFLADVRHLKHKNLAIEMLRKLLNDEIRHRAMKNLMQSKTFSEMLEQTIRKYQNRTLETAQVINELIELAKDMKKAQKRGDDLKLSEEELAFYDALEVNDSAVKVLGDDVLCQIARDLTETLRNNVTIDWTVKESVRAKLRVLVKRLLKKYDYPPDKQEKATRTVLEQAELLAQNWEK